MLAESLKTETKAVEVYGGRRAPVEVRHCDTIWHRSTIWHRDTHGGVRGPPAGIATALHLSKTRSNGVRPASIDLR